MTAVRYDGADWPATVSIGPGWYGLRIEHDDGTSEVRYVAATKSDGPAQRPCVAATPGLRTKVSRPPHSGATCEAA